VTDPAAVEVGERPDDDVISELDVVDQAVRSVVSLGGGEMRLRVVTRSADAAFCKEVGERRRICG
jgi:hypothetical protein